jgi:hypothetical protein
MYAKSKRQAGFPLYKPSLPDYYACMNMKQYAKALARMETLARGAAGRQGAARVAAFWAQSKAGWLL